MKQVLLLACTFLVGGTFALNCQRSVEVTTAGEVKINITINKDDIKGIARLAEVLPEGATVKYAKIESGAFKIDDNKLKFIWMALPGESEVKVSYILNTEKLNEGICNIKGKFSYVVDNQAVDYEMPVTALLLDDKKNIVDHNTAMASAITSATLTNKNTNVASKSVSKVTYKVQVGSSTEKISVEQFKKYKFEYPVVEMEANGLTKYTSGEFTTLDEAIKYKQDISNKGVKDAFVLPVYNGKIISIAEAKKIEAATK